MQNDRWSETRRNLERIHARMGTVYTLGLLMGILTRLSQTDYQLYKDIETRAKKAEQDDS
jgi:type VI protein secretion system component VasK